MRTRRFISALSLDALAALRALSASIPLATLVACHAQSTPEGRPAIEPALANNAQAPVTPVDAGTLDAAADAASPPLDEGMPKLVVVLDDPRLSIARERDRARDPAGAARAVDAAMATATLAPAELCAWAFVAGRLHLQANETALAVVSYEHALGPDADAGPPCTLAPYLALRDAEALVRTAKPEAALARLRTVSDDLAARDEVRLTLADAHVGGGDRASAVPLWRAVLASAPHGVRWADTSLQLAAALLDGVDGRPSDHATEVLDLTTRVMVESPGVIETSDVLGLRVRAAQLARLPVAPALTALEQARQAQAWLDAANPKRASDVAGALLQTLSRGDPHPEVREAACKAAVVRAQASPRVAHPGPHGTGPAATAEAWGLAIDRCDAQEPLPSALYYGAKASTSAHRDAEALDRFARLEKLFPTHRFADDARVREAVIAQGQGDSARYVSLLASVPDTYPDGDMKGEALFRVALEKLGARDLDGARAMLDRSLTLPSEDRATGSAGRAAYFRARVSQLAGDIPDARARYATLVETQPLSFYMLLANHRLAALDADAARAAVAAAAAREAQESPGPFLTRSHPELTSAAFDRFARLLEVGDIDAARREASAGGLVADGVDPEVLWTVASCYEQAGAPGPGHAYARGRLLDFRMHWPTGRWQLAWQIAYPRPWADVVVAESASAGIPAPLTWSIMREESAFNPEAKSGANAIGLMQLLVGTGRQIARGSLVVDEDTLTRPEVSIALGTRLLASMRASFPANPSLAIAAYNSGSVPVRRWLTERGGDSFDEFVERIPYEETRNYIKRVLTSEAAYAYLYAPEALAELYALPERAAGAQAGSNLASP
jgi:soluble lytic murein transglycosylase